MLSFIIPFRDSGDGYRKKILDWNVKRLRSLLVTGAPQGGEIIVSDTEDLIFHRSRARNLGAQKATGELLCFVDADTVWDPVLLNGVQRLMTRDDVVWAIPYDRYCRLNESSTRALLGGATDVLLSKRDVGFGYTEVLTASGPTPYDGNAVSGLVAVRRGDFMECGGYPEKFEGWGCEDRAFAVGMDKFIGPHSRISGSVYHLWHPEPRVDTFDQPKFWTNQGMYEEIKAVGDLVRLRKIYGRWV